MASPAEARPARCLLNDGRTHLTAALPGPSRCSFFLANGDEVALEGFPVIREGMANAEPIRPLLSLPSQQPSAATLAVQRQQLVVVDLNTANRCARGAPCGRGSGSGHTVPRRRSTSVQAYIPLLPLPSTPSPSCHAGACAGTSWTTGSSSTRAAAA